MLPIPKEPVLDKIDGFGGSFGPEPVPIDSDIINILNLCLIYKNKKL